VPDVKEKLLKGYAAGRTTFKVHLDGYDLAPFFNGETTEAPRRDFLHWNDDGKLVALRYNRWKARLRGAERPRDRSLGAALHGPAPAGDL
jgi:arylsulfatase A-like enzyme